MNPLPLSHYAHAVRPDLPADAFKPVPTRLAWLSLHLLVIAAGIWAIAHGLGGWPGALGCSLVVGHSFAGCAFVGHETLHGAVVRGRLARLILGWICFLPFTLSPRLWVAWHNGVHHGNTMIDGIDPDAYPTLAQFRASRTTRAADFISFGYHRWAGFMTLLLGFTGQSMQMLMRFARQRGWLSPREHNLATFETVLGVAFWTGVGVLVGGKAFLFAFVIPLGIANMVVMGYILTNHSLSPMTDVNDPLLNSLSVTVPPVLERMHLNFGYHVEHHLFPAMSSHHAPAVRASLQRRFPDRYQSLPALRALYLLATTPRVYRDATTLVDPATGYSASTLGPKVLRPISTAAASSASPSPSSEDDLVPAIFEAS